MSFFRRSDGGLTRRMVALFMLCALLPLGVAMSISYLKTHELLVGQRVGTLRAVASSYATSLVERLDLADTLARLAADDLDGGRDPGLRSMAKYFSAAVVVEDGGPRALFGRAAGAPSPAAFDSLQEQLATGASVVVLEPALDAGRVWIARRLAPRGSERWLALALNPQFIWSAEELPFATDVCILSEDRRPLNCTGSLWAAAGASLRRGPTGPGGSFSWDEGGQQYLAGYHEMFLRGRYGADSWIVVATQQEALALAPVRALGWLAVPLVVLGLLLAALLGLIQVRRTLRPLRELTHATARIGARDFTTRLTAQGNDEFGALAVAFNSMSCRLGQQFSALQAHSEIDSLILSGIDLKEVADIVLHRLAGMVAAQRYWLLLRVPGSAERFTVFGSRPHAPLERPTVVLAQAERERLREGTGTGTFRALDERHGFALPIVLGSELGGVLVLGYDERHHPGAEDVALMRDIADRIAVAMMSARRDEELEHRANYDALTGLPNRLLGTDALSHAVAAAARESRLLAVLFVDLDGFAEVNDSAGHTAGDQVLVQAAERLRGCVRKSDFIARLGGDEFAIVLTEVREPAAAAVVAAHVIDSISRPFSVGTSDLLISASVGIAIYPGDGSSAEDLLRHADLALYRAKQSGRRQFAFFEAMMNEEVRRRRALAGELRRALDDQQFELHYQPQLDLRTNVVTGAEALIRWKHPVRGLLLPTHFISFAEHSALIEEIGHWALSTAAHQFMAWQSAGVPIEHVSVNVAARQLQKPGFATVVFDVLRQTQMPAAALRLELTESAVIESAGATAANLAALLDLGVVLELDDFGTGYSSLAYLQRLPIATVKLDRAFIRTIESSAGTQAVVQAAIDMVHALGKKVTAEGVEYAGQKAVLARLGCDAMQGFLLSRPMPTGEFGTFAVERRAAFAAAS